MDYNLIYFDIETLNDFMTMTYQSINDKKGKYLILAHNNLDNNLKFLEQLLLTPKTIFIAWNSAYDKTMLANLIYIFKHYETLKNTDKTLNNFISKHSQYSKNEIVLRYMKYFNDKFIKKQYSFDFLYEEVLKEKYGDVKEVDKLPVKDYSYNYLNSLKDKRIIFYDAMKEHLNPISLKSYQANTGMEIKEFINPFKRTNPFDIFYEEAEKDNYKILKELLKYNLNDTSSLLKLHSLNLETLIAKKTLCEFFKLPLHYIEKKTGALLDYLFEYKDRKKVLKQDHCFKADIIPLNQEKTWYDFMIYSTYYNQRTLNQPLKEVLDTIKENTTNPNNPYYEIINKLFNATFKLIKLPSTLNDSKENIKEFADINIPSKQRKWYKNFLGKEYYQPFINIPFLINTKYGPLKGHIKNGGIHSAINNATFKEVSLKDLDSQYPSMKINFNLFSRNMKENSKLLYSNLRDKRVEIKREAKTKSGTEKEYLSNLANAIKLPLNTAYGTLNAEYYDNFDPDNAKRICYLGELLLLYMSYLLFEIDITTIQHNTDGIMTDKDNEKVPAVMEKFHKDTKMSSTNDFYDILIQKDVNNYIAYNAEHNEYHNKGAFIKNSDLDTTNEKALTKSNFVMFYNIIGKMITNKLLFNKDFDTTISENKAILNYIKVVKTNDKNPIISIVDKDTHTDLDYKVYRLIATKNGKNFMYKKVDKFDNSKYTFNAIAFSTDKMENLLEDIKNKTIEDYDVDLDYYKELAMSIYAKISNKLTTKEIINKVKKQKLSILDIYPDLLD